MSHKPTLRLLGIGLLVLSAIPLIPAFWHMPEVSQNTTSILDWGTPPPGGWTLDNEIEVQLRPNAMSTQPSAIAGIMGGGSAQWNGPLGAETGIMSLQLPIGAIADAVLAKLRSDPRVEAADFVHQYTIPVDKSNATPGSGKQSDSASWKPNDPLYDRQWNFQMINAEKAWEINRGKGVTVDPGGHGSAECVNADADAVSGLSETVPSRTPHAH